MAFYRHYQCPDCNGVFKYLHTLSDEPPPDRCDLCGSWMSDEEPVFVPQAPAVRGVSASTKAVDDVYEGMVDASKVRTELMAEMGGGSASDYNHTVITNMRSNAKEGETSFVPPPSNPVTQAMAAAPNLTGHQASAMAFTEANRYGVGAYAGEGARQAVRAQHNRQVSELVGRGTMGSYAGGRK
jgi:hypothetical protein